MNQERQNKGINIINFIVALLGILAPGAYLIGISFHQGTLSAYGIETSVFPIYGPDVYVTAYYAIGYYLLAIGVLISDFLDLIFKPPVIYLVIIIVLAVILAVYLAIKHFKNVELLKKTKFWRLVGSIFSKLHWKNNDFTKAVGIVGVSSYGVIFLLSLIAMVGVFWWLLPYTAYVKAQKIEIKKIDDYQKMVVI